MATRSLRPKTFLDQLLTPDQSSQRIAKLISRSGICSRREAEQLVTAGKVKINNTIVKNPATNVNMHDKIFVSGKLIPPIEPTKLWLHNKIRGMEVSQKPQRHNNLFEYLRSAGIPHCVSVGRLDVMTEGLILLTNNGDLANFLSHPKYEFERKYQITPEKLDALRNGVFVDSSKRYSQMQATIDKIYTTNAWLTITLHEGKHRQIRDALKQLHLQVNRIIRTQYGPYKLENIASGETIEVPVSDALKIVESPS